VWTWQARSLDHLIAADALFEERVRRMAIWCWSASFVALPLVGVILFIVDNAGGSSVDLARWCLAPVGIGGILSLTGAILATCCWLFRLRGASLAAIERRLAALENILQRREP
jgi:hypothetical protein